MDLPPPLTLSDPNSFGGEVFRERHSKLLNQLLGVHPYQKEQQAALHALVVESLDGLIRALPPDAPDADLWHTWDMGNIGKSWSEITFLWGESYFYRRLLDAVGYFNSGAWSGVDPFKPLKAAELRDPFLESEYAWLDNMPSVQRRSFDIVLLASLYGNRADLGFKLQKSRDTFDVHEQLVADDTEAVWQHLVRNAPQRINIVMDNAGRETLSDLVLVDFLLTQELANQVVLHVKPHPYYVSDATTGDVGDCLRRLMEMSGEAGLIGYRVHQAAADDRFIIQTHPFWCAPLSYHHMPTDLTDVLCGGFAIFKGDLNYRRVVGDCAWDPTTSINDVAQYLPAPSVLLRTLKSEVVVGLDHDRVCELDAAGDNWRTDGSHALIQYV